MDLDRILMEESEGKVKTFDMSSSESSNTIKYTWKLLQELFQRSFRELHAAFYMLHQLKLETKWWFQYIIILHCLHNNILYSFFSLEAGCLFPNICGHYFFFIHLGVSGKKTFSEWQIMLTLMCESLMSMVRFRWIRMLHAYLQSIY